MHYRRRELIQFIRRTRSKTSQSGQFIRKTKAKTVQATKHRQPHDPRNKHTPRLRSCRSDIPCTLTSHSAAWFGRLVALPTQEDRLQTTNTVPNTRGRRPDFPPDQPLRPHPTGATTSCPSHHQVATQAMQSREPTHRVVVASSFEIVSSTILPPSGAAAPTSTSLTTTQSCTIVVNPPPHKGEGLQGGASKKVTT